MTNSKILIAYYSRKGQNYVAGKIENLAVGNTEVVAKKIQAITGGDLFEIETVKAYPVDYTETTQVAMDEKRSNARPELAATVDNMNAYDVIYLGYPNWWNTFPMAVFTFLESYNLSGKTIIPFCTHEGSGPGNSERDIKKLCPNSKVLTGLAIRGSNVSSADNEIKNWMKDNA
ncbi:MAG: flavodoxin [Paludibacter sp.]|nr:flavodoxin [Paludibacter sp.]